jgi:DNA-damage-inducible protein J
MTEQINIKIERDLKEDVDYIFKQLGLSTTDAVRIFFKRVQFERGIPFEMKVKDEITWNSLNEETKAAISVAKNEKGKLIKNIKDMWRDHV